jgi:hypothetical protein
VRRSKRVVRGGRRWTDGQSRVIYSFRGPEFTEEDALGAKEDNGHWDDGIREGNLCLDFCESFSSLPLVSLTRYRYPRWFIGLCAELIFAIKK